LTRPKKKICFTTLFFVKTPRFSSLKQDKQVVFSELKMKIPIFDKIKKINFSAVFCKKESKKAQKRAKKQKNYWINLRFCSFSCHFVVKFVWHFFCKFAI